MHSTKPRPVVVVARDVTLYFVSIHECARKMGITTQRIRRALASPDGELVAGKKHYFVDDMLPSTLAYVLAERDAFSP